MAKKEGIFKASDLRGKTLDELTETFALLKKEAFNLRFQKVTGELSSTARIRQVRRNAARVMGIIKEKQPAGAKNA